MKKGVKRGLCGMLTLVMVLMSLSTWGFAGNVKDANVTTSGEKEIEFTKTNQGTSTFNSIAWNGEVFVAVAENGDIIYSKDAIFWDKVATKVEDLQDVYWNGKQFLVVGNRGKYLTSDNGQDWVIGPTIKRASGSDYTEHLEGIAWNGSMYAVVSNSGNILTTKDAKSWNIVSTGTGGTFYSIAWNGSMFVAVGAGGSVVISKDANTWTSIATGIEGISYLDDIIWDGNKFIAVGQSSDCARIITSTNGVKWSLVHKSSVYNTSLRSVIYTGSQYISVGGYFYNDSTVLRSVDGSNWIQESKTKADAIYDIVWNGSQFVAVGMRGLILVSDPQPQGGGVSVAIPTAAPTARPVATATPAPTPVQSNEPVLRSISFSETEALLKPGETLEFDVYAEYSNGSQEKITNEEELILKSSSASTVKANPGMLIGMKNGKSTITATYQGKSGTLPVTVSSVTVKTLEASIKSAKMKAGDSIQVDLIAKMSDGTKKDVTDAAVWTTDDSTVARVDKGEIEAITSGTAVIKASYGDKNTVMSIKVEDAKQVKFIKISNKNIKLLKGDTMELRVWAQYEDGTEEEVTDEDGIVWTTSKQSIAEVSRDGVVEGRGPGKTTISVNYKGFSLKTSVEVVTQLNVKSLTVNKTKLTMNKGAETQLVIIATYSDNTKSDVTSEVLWAVKQSNIADVEAGLVQAKISGTTTVTAKYGGKTISVSVKVN